MPSDAQSAYSLLRAAIQDPNPVVVLEPRILYAERGEVDTKIIATIGKANLRQSGDKLTIVASGQMVGIAEKAIKAGIQTVVFDRNGYLYHGRVKSLADSAREGGLKF